jgi:hypothetical protein
MNNLFNRLFLFAILLLLSFCTKEESCLYQRSPAPYVKVDLIVCNDGTRIDTKAYNAHICDRHNGIEDVYSCEPN